MTTSPHELDSADPLAAMRDRFVIDDDLVAYLDGNSLGRLPRATLDRLAAFVREEWGGRLIRGWSEGWVELPVTVGDELGAALLGAAAGQTVIADSTSVCIYKLLHAAAGLRPGRDEIVIDATNFPTDRYLVEAVAEARGMTVRWIEPDLVDNVTADVLAGALGDRTAVVLLSHVDYRSGTLLDLPGLTEAVHAAGALVIWDLCHSAGVVPIALDASGADFAVGCTYKYVNAGPGAPAYVYVAQRHLTHARQPIEGWWSAADLFGMSDTYEASPSIRRMLSGTPSVAGILAVQEGVRLIAEVGVEAIRAKSELMTGHAIELLDELGLELVTPGDAALRGSHVTVRHPDARAITAQLIERGVVPDFREPDLIRLGLSPLTTSYAELAAATRILGEVVAPIG
ncbi:kynureninase [Aeromicrobium fastidiosum]|uniref:Kynureninase n=1 Tax=Aeromicrobium fastidiosum TaxID=52699 RepID=A0A641ALC8_9ACTN|nr:kynureninase [Aeromicrobium fastidiosum]KAA1376490.1 kynureninase [Aeromicrobium fastidiosum]MBP2391592.1 kynureninase [Aeromicrobium fastidiosum]